MNYQLQVGLLFEFKAHTHDGIYFLEPIPDSESAFEIADNKSDHLRKPKFFNCFNLFSSILMFTRDNNMLDCSRACFATCEKQYIFSF